MPTIKRLLRACSPPRLRELILLMVLAVLVVLDQCTKLAVSHYFAMNETRVIIPGVLHFTLAHNEGAAFSMLSGYPYVFMSVTCVVVVAGMALLAVRFFKSNFTAFAVTLVMAGGIGNLIDRFSQGYVVDFFEFAFVRFAIFNVADCCVVVGAFMIIGYYLFDMIRDARRLHANPDDGEPLPEPEKKDGEGL